MQDYKSLCAVVCTVLVNTQTHTAFDHLYAISSASRANKMHEIAICVAIKY